MLHLTIKEKKELFKKCWATAKQSGKTGEEFLDEVFFLIEEQYDRWDPLNGLTLNEQMGFEKHFKKWAQEMPL